jgi:hypothetical protein
MIKDKIARANENVVADNSEGASALASVNEDAAAVSVTVRVRAKGSHVWNSIFKNSAIGAHPSQAQVKAYK